MEKLKEMLKDKKIVYSLIAMLFVIIISIGFTYSYFTSTMTGTDGSVSVKSATIGGVTFTAESINGTSVLPGWSSGEKTLTVSTDKTDYDIPYECTLNISSDIINDMYLYVSGDNAYTANNGVQVIKGAMIIASGKLNPSTATNTTVSSATMKYELKFKETGTSQNSEQGKTLSATVTCSVGGVNKLYYSNGMIGVRAFGYDSSGNPITVNVETPINSASLKAAIDSSDSSLGVTAEQVQGAKIIGLTASGSGERTVRIVVSDVASTGETVALLHYDEANEEWEKVDDYVVDGNGEITATISDFSPFALVNKGIIEPEPVWSYVDSDNSETINIGDKITFVGSSGKETEAFYVISTDSTNQTITMLSEYKINTSGTIKQSSSASGTSFSPSFYFTPYTEINVYDNRSRIKEPLESYSDYLTTNGATLNSLRLIKLSELTDPNIFNCSLSKGTCPNTYSWLNNCWYWTQSAASNGDIYTVEGSRISSCDYIGLYGDDMEFVYGIRPVVTINESEI